MPLRVGYVREHFSSPLLQFSAVDEGQTFTLVECPGGTGQLISRLANDEIDVALALTDALISGLANGSKAYKLVGSFVSTPLNWYSGIPVSTQHMHNFLFHAYRDGRRAVITGKHAQYQGIPDLEGTTIGISRPGSGSQTMAYVMALQQGWSTDGLKFKANNDIHGLISSVNDGSTSAFMWEWFTTKPYVDAGKVRFIGSVPTPWPSWLIAAHPSQERAPSGEVRAFLVGLTKYIREFDSADSRAGKNVEYIKANFGYPADDIEAWLKTVAYPQDCLVISEKVITDTLSVLEKAGVVKAPEGGFDVRQFVQTKVANLV